MARFARQMSTFNLSRMPSKYAGAARLFRRFFFIRQPFRVFRLEIVVGIAEQRFRAGHKFRIVVAQAQRGLSSGGEAMASTSLSSAKPGCA